MDWSTWFQNVSAGVIDKAAQNRYTQQYEIDRLRLEQLGQLGTYTEGQPLPPQAGTVAGINTSVLIIGGVVLLAVMLLKD